MTKHVTWFPAQGGGMGGTPDFKWQGWSNGGKNKTPQEIPSASNKTPQNPWTKIQPPKTPTPNFQGIKISRSGRNTWTITNLQIVLNTPKYPIHIKLPQKYLPKYSCPKEIPKSKILNPRKSFDHPCHLKSGVPPPPFPAYIIFINGRSLTWYQTFTKKEHYIILTRSRNTEMNPLFRTSGNKAFFVNVIHKDSSRQCYYKTSTTEEPSLFTNLTVTPL